METSLSPSLQGELNYRALAPLHDVRGAGRNGGLVFRITNSASLISVQDILVETPVAFSGNLHGIFRKS